MLGIASLSVWLVALGVYVVSLIPGVQQEVLRLYDGPFVAIFVAVLLLASLALAASGQDAEGLSVELNASKLRTFYRFKPRFTWYVQSATLVLCVATFVLLLGSFGFKAARVRFDHGVCRQTLDGVTTILDAHACAAVRIGFMRAFASAWIAVGWLAVAQFLFAPPDERLRDE